jgi:hypothetical protein
LKKKYGEGYRITLDCASFEDQCAEAVRNHVMKMFPDAKEFAEKKEGRLVF